MSTKTEPGARITVETYTDIEETTSRITERQQQLIKEILNNDLDDGEAVVWLPEFITNHDMKPVSGAEQLFIAEIEDYSEDAYAVAQGGMDDPDFVSKNWSVVFEAEGDVCIESGQTGLSSFEE